MDSIQGTILENIRSKKKGTVLFIETFEEFGSNEAVRKAFSRLCKANIILRLAKGIYFYPSNKERTSLSIEDIAKAVAKRDKATILPTGVYAQHRLGISTQIPTNLVYLTNGTARTLKIQNNTIKFKRGVAKNFMYKSEIVYLIVSSLREMYDLPNEKVQNRLKSLLKIETPEKVEHDLTLAPRHIRLYLKKILSDEN